jgi:hypothetical protein
MAEIQLSGRAQRITDIEYTIKGLVNERRVHVRNRFHPEDTINEIESLEQQKTLLDERIARLKARKVGVDAVDEIERVDDRVQELRQELLLLQNDKTVARFVRVQEVVNQLVAQGFDADLVMALMAGLGEPAAEEVQS